MKDPCTVAECDRVIWAKGLCRMHYQQEYRARNPEKWAAYSAAYSRRHRARIRERRLAAYRADPAAGARQQLAARLRRDFGLTLEQYDKLVAGPCHICGAERTDNGTRPSIVLDHCHATNVVRGALCQLCNTGLGKFADSPELLRIAADYLEKHARPVCDNTGFERLPGS